MGSIERIPKDTKQRATAYRVRWRDDAGVQRKELFRLDKGKNKADAERHLAEVENSKHQGRYVDLTNTTTVAQAVRRRIDSMSYSENTRTNRESQLRTHVEGTRLGSMRLIAVRRSHVQEWVTERSRLENPLAPSSIRLILGLIRATFNGAVEDRAIGHNPTTGRFFIPAVAVEPVVPLTVAEVRALAAKMPERLQAAVLIAAGTGLRVMELLGLQLDDVATLKREMYVRQQLHRRGRRRVALKTVHSRRDLPLAQVVVDELARHLAQYPAAEGFIFTDDQGRPWTYDAFADSFSTAATAAGLEATPHDTRHHFASTLLDAGESVVVVAKRLGHADATLVISTYGHLVPGTEDRTRKAIDAAWCAPDVPSAVESVL